MRLRQRIMVVAIACAIAVQTVSPAMACTGIRIRPADGSIIYARTLEFGTDLQSNILITPRDMKFVGSAPGNKPGIAWTSKYAAVGANAYRYQVFVDGLNEKGLAVGLFYFPGYAQYQTVAAGDESKTLGPHELGAYLLTTCATTAEAVSAAQRVKVGEVVLKEFGFVPPAHFVIHDASGDCKVLEYVGGTLRVHDNPLGVMSNAPTFDWHMTNLANYINLSTVNPAPREVSGVKVAAFGQGAGMLGLPGDFTPPSRFVRAVVFSQAALPVATAEEGMKAAFHLLNQFDIPEGTARDKAGAPTAEYTLWTSAADLKNLNYCFRTHANSRIRIVHLKKCNLTADRARFISMAGDEVFQDATGDAK